VTQIPTLESRMRVVEEALIGDPRPGRVPGLVETQRMQSQDIKELKASVKVIGEKVDTLVKDKQGEAKERAGEKRAMEKLTKTLQIALLVITILGGSFSLPNIIELFQNLSR
jgi:hypothetical protein